MISNIAFVLATAAAVNAHTKVFSVDLNGAKAGSDMIHAHDANNPVKDLSSKDLTCNLGGAASAKTALAVKPGDKITLNWGHNAEADDIIATSHVGPVMAYIAPADSKGAGPVWVKIADEGYANGLWGTLDMVAKKGKQEITLPKLKAGKYIVRGEMIGLHEANDLHSQNPGRGAQLYPECITIDMGAGGSASLPAGIAIPGEYKDSDPGIHFDVYSGAVSSYKSPGGKVWDGSSAGGSSGGSSGGSGSGGSGSGGSGSGGSGSGGSGSGGSGSGGSGSGSGSGGYPGNGSGSGTTMVTVTVTATAPGSCGPTPGGYNSHH